MGSYNLFFAPTFFRSCHIKPNTCSNVCILQTNITQLCQWKYKVFLYTVSVRLNLLFSTQITNSLRWGSLPLTYTFCHACCIVWWGTALITRIRVSTILFKFQVSLKYSITTADPTYFWKSAHTCRLPTWNSRPGTLSFINIIMKAQKCKISQCNQPCTDDRAI